MSETLYRGGTASVAQAMAMLLIVAAPATAGSLYADSGQQTRNARNMPAVASRPKGSETQFILVVDSGSPVIQTDAEALEECAAVRPTSAQEEAIGELRGWALLDANWDGEGAIRPNVASLREAEAFVRLLESENLPEPMLLANGRGGLYWNDNGIYADLEFTGDGNVTYFVEHGGFGRHKGVVKFDGEKLPRVLLALLEV